MRKLILSTAAITIVLSASAAFAMGGGGGSPTSGGSTYGGSTMGPSMTHDEYTVALRLIRHQQYADAIPHLELALADKPNSADILNYLGYTKRMTGAYDDSLDYYKRALAIDPNHKGVHEYLGELYLQKNDLPSAHDELAKLVTLCPSGCDERDTLEKAIADYKPPSAAAAPAAASPVAQ